MIVMPGLRIQKKKRPADKPERGFDLKDFLAAAGERVIKSRGRCRDLCVLASFNGQNDLYRMSRLKLSGEELLEMASKIRQTISPKL